MIQRRPFVTFHVRTLESQWTLKIHAQGKSCAIILALDSLYISSGNIYALKTAQKFKKSVHFQGEIDLNKSKHSQLYSGGLSHTY